MMTSVAQSYSPHAAALQQQHPGVAQGHPMSGVHPQQGRLPGAGIPQQAFHMGASGPGVPQASQPGAMMAGMPPGMNRPGAPNAHALQHLNPTQAAMFQQQQQQMAFGNPQMQQQLAHQQLLQHQPQTRQQQAARQAMLAQHYNGGVPMNLMNGMNPGMNATPFAAMRQTAPRMPPPVTLPHHLQQQQQQAQLTLEQQQAQTQHHQQLMAMQQMQNATGHTGPQGQPNQMSPQQIHNLQMAQQHQQHQQQQQAQQQLQQQQQLAAQQQHQQRTHSLQTTPSTAGQQPQAPPQQQSQPNQQPPPQSQPQPQPLPPQQQQTAIPATMMPSRPRIQKGQCILRLLQFGDHLSQFVATKQQTDLNYWARFVQTFFSPTGVLRHSVWIVDEQTTKQYEISFPALARYFYTHFESGVKNMQLVVENSTEKELPNHCNYISSEKSSFIYWFENGSQLVASGKLKAQFDANQMIELLEFETTNHEEYLPRTKVVEAARPLHEWQKDWQKVNASADGKQSPEMNKKGKTRPLKSPPTQPPDIDIPDSKIKINMGITPSVFRFLELVEVMGQMNPLFGYSHQHSSLAPYSALEQYVAQVPHAAALNSAGIPQGSHNPSLHPFGFSSPAPNPVAASDASNPNAMNAQNIGMGAVQNSPSTGNMQASAMALQRSQQGSSSGVSATTSPNANNKRRRASVKEEETGQANGIGPTGLAGAQGQGGNVGNKVKPSPRIGGKRQKGGPA